MATEATETEVGETQVEQTASEDTEQAADATEVDADETPGGEVSEESEKEAEAPSENELLRKELLGDYTKKTQALAEEKREFEAIKRKAEMLEKLQDHGPFQEWMKSQREGKAPETGVTPEEWRLMQEDDSGQLLNQKLGQIISQQVQHILQSQVGPSLEQAQSTIKSMSLDRELERVAKTYTDFDDLNKAGKLDSFIEKGYDYESAYKLAKFEDLNNGGLKRETDTKAKELLGIRKAGSIGKPLGAPKGGRKVVTFANLEDAMTGQIMAELNGEKIDAQVKK